MTKIKINGFNAEDVSIFGFQGKQQKVNHTICPSCKTPYWNKPRKFPKQLKKGGTKK